MPRGTGELLLVNVEEERTDTGRQWHDEQLMPSENRGLSCCDSLLTMEEVEGGGMWLVGFEVNILFV